MKLNPAISVIALSLALTPLSQAISVVPLLTDGFENYPVGPIPSALPSEYSLLVPPPGAQGDPATVTSGTVNDGASIVNPNSGSQMLRFLQSHSDPTSPNSGRNSDVVYLLDLHPFASEVATGTASMHLSASFNRGAAALHDAFILEMRAYDGVAADFPADWFTTPIDWTTTAGSSLLPPSHVPSPLYADSDPTTWEEDWLEFTLPANTGYVAVRLYARENAPGVLPDPITGYDFRSHYADDVNVELSFDESSVPEDPVPVPEPGSSLLFLSMGLVSLAGVRRKLAKRD